MTHDATAPVGLEIPKLWRAAKWEEDLAALAAAGHRNLALAQFSVRHEALLVRMEVRDRPSPRRRSGGVKLREA